MFEIFLTLIQEDDLRSKEEQYVLMQQLWKERESKVRLQLNEREKGRVDKC